MGIRVYEDNRAIDYQDVHTVRISPSRILIVVSVILFFTLILIWSRINFIAASYRMSSLNVETQKIDQQIGQYNLEVATLKSRSRIERIARTRLNLVYPDARQVILIDK